MDIKALIYSKSFDDELTHKLLQIADSSTLVEDLIDLIGEMAREPDEECDSPHHCSHIDDLKNEKEELEEEFSTFKSQIKDELLCIQDELVEIMDDCE